jgi:proteic killer suppression protein
LQLKYKSKSLEKECTDYSKAIRSYGQNCAKILHRRIQELKAAETLEEMVNFRIGRCHPLKGDYLGKYALDLEHPLRLIVEPEENEDSRYQVKIVNLLEVTDYHGN